MYYYCNGEDMQTTASAPGKVILCGEHAVVYGQPAIALPLADVRATAVIQDQRQGSGLVVHTPDTGERWHYASSQQHPFALLIGSTLAQLGCPATPDVEITLRSALAIASGVGSGAALGAALVKAVVQHHRRHLSPAEV